ncbi:putative F0F1-ATPase subunit (Ca2+/Mg2+ transporter) [Mucilaginibacter oryzae]|uniref:Putative F0F1-ATPase subunit (Ca2+/Mg2+ transporter) n=1 Tax=Mucilaginibacter oryzae TaxID=468058 RepID=A0A316HAM7_9SPHI|nr:AtpZ/AtpI family protein [Mucilaginibacter oryzae]PWK77526.1 putative F0F1-ATPase subunit (Ca2+/Mg2+ transporter) [Mucilaginibacter oryzae]
MPENERGNKNDTGKQVSSYARFTGIAFQMIVIIGVCAFAGYKIDERTGHTVKWVTAALSLAGVFIALFLVIRSVKN